MWTVLAHLSGPVLGVAAVLAVLGASARPIFRYPFMWRYLETRRVIHVRRLFGNKMRLIQLQVSVSTYCYHPGSNGPGSEKPWIDSTFA
jgi:hypothetical protein